MEILFFMGNDYRELFLHHIIGSWKEFLVIMWCVCVVCVFGERVERKDMRDLIHKRQCIDNPVLRSISSSDVMYNMINIINISVFYIRKLRVNPTFCFFHYKMLFPFLLFCAYMR